MNNINIEDWDWIPVVGYPGYEVSGYGVVCKMRKDGSREILTPYREKKPDKNGRKLAYVTLYKNCQFKKVSIIEIMKTTWQPECERRKKVREAAAAQNPPEEKKSEQSGKTAGKAKRTTDRNEQTRKFKEMIDGYEPEKMSISAYMKYLREQGYRFTSAHLSAELSKKKRQMENQKESNGLF